MRGTMTWIMRASLALILLSSLPATAQTAPLGRTPCDAMSITSPPGKAWWAEHRWRYPSDAVATTAYQALVNNGNGGSAWPVYYQPTPTDPPTHGVLTSPPVTILPVGTRFQMAMAPAPGQPDNSPGGWGTFDYIGDVQDVREFLAVTHSFKPVIDRVVTYEVTRMLPVWIGPVGPQVDAQTCEYFAGRWSQFNMLVPWNERMDYLKIVEVRPIR